MTVSVKIVLGLS